MIRWYIQSGERGRPLCGRAARLKTKGLSVCSAGFAFLTLRYFQANGKWKRANGESWKWESQSEHSVIAKSAKVFVTPKLTASPSPRFPMANGHELRTKNQELKAQTPQISDANWQKAKAQVHRQRQSAGRQPHQAGKGVQRRQEDPLSAYAEAPGGQSREPAQGAAGSPLQTFRARLGAGGGPAQERPAGWGRRRRSTTAT